MQELAEDIRKFQELVSELELASPETGMLDDLAAKVLESRRLVDEVTDLLRRTSAAKENIEATMIQRMQENGLTSVTSSGNSFTWSEKTRFSVLKENQDALFDYLREIGKGDMIKVEPSVHAGTLSAYFSKEHPANEPLPEFVKKNETVVLTVRKKIT